MENVLLSSEIDLYVDTMKCYNISDIGTKHWTEWHGRVSKLNQQAILEASEMREEAVKEVLVSSGKIPILIHEAICIAIWKNKLLPLILKYEPDPSNTFTVYSVLYHETTCVTLLETILFHSNSCETLDDSALDLFDYCYEAVTKLFHYKYVEPDMNEKAHQEINRQKSDLEFDIGIRAISIIRYFAEYLERLPLSVTKRMLSDQDVPLLLSELIVSTPWKRTDAKDNIFKYTGGRWQKLSGTGLLKLTHTEAQTWLGLRQLLLNPELATHYELTSARKDRLLKLQKYLHDTVLDQLSPLVELKQWLCHLAVMEPPARTRRTFVLEVLPQIKQNILSENADKWKDIARKQIQLFFKQNHEDMVELAQSLSEAYNSDILEKLEKTYENPCGGCGINAAKVCSRCKKEWYCSRNCQVKHWPQHKESCDAQVGAN